MVGAQHRALEPREPAPPRGSDQPLHQHARDAAALPGVGDDDRELGALAVGVGDVARDADERLAALARPSATATSASSRS